MIPAEDIILGAKAADGYDNLRLSVLSTFGIDFDIPEEEFTKSSEQDLTRKLYDTVYAAYKPRTIRPEKRLYRY